MRAEQCVCDGGNASAGKRKTTDGAMSLGEQVRTQGKPREEVMHMAWRTDSWEPGGRQICADESILC